MISKIQAYFRVRQWARSLDRTLYAWWRWADLDKFERDDVPNKHYYARWRKEIQKRRSRDMRARGLAE